MNERYDEHHQTISHNDRARLLIYPKFQIALLAFNWLILLGAFGSIWLQIQNITSRFHAFGTEAQLGVGHGYFAFIEMQSRMLYMHLLVAFGTAAILTTALTLVISHRLAGPLARMKHHFEKTADSGRFKPIHFRTDDFLSEMAPAINEAFRSVEARAVKVGQVGPHLTLVVANLNDDPTKKSA